MIRITDWIEECEKNLDLIIKYERDARKLIPVIVENRGNRLRIMQSTHYNSYMRLKSRVAYFTTGLGCLGEASRYAYRPWGRLFQKIDRLQVDYPDKDRMRKLRRLTVEAWETNLAGINAPATDVKMKVESQIETMSKIADMYEVMRMRPPPQLLSKLEKKMLLLDQINRKQAVLIPTLTGGYTTSELLDKLYKRLDKLYEKKKELEEKLRNEKNILKKNELKWYLELTERKIKDTREDIERILSKTSSLKTLEEEIKRQSERIRKAGKKELPEEVKKEIASIDKRLGEIEEEEKRLLAKRESKPGEFLLSELDILEALNKLRKEKAMLLRRKRALLGA